ncbi:MAG: esterase family protein [Gemmataceae bacterium]|nr:esterase family protein [Gemmataceae bacterium]
MDPFCWAVLFWIDGLGLGQAPRWALGFHPFERVQGRLHGQLLDFTHNHGRDRRLWSSALGQKRDLYVYLPPGYDGVRRYPLAIFLHGAGQDENFFFQAHVINTDRAIAAGDLPPFIIAAPDGSYRGRATILKPATFWTNSKMGCFEDWVMRDVWDFMHTNFAVRPGRENHALIGVSMGGSASYTLAFKYRERIKMAIGVHPPLHLRYADSNGNYRVPFDPDNMGLRDRLRPFQRLGTRKLITLRFHDLFGHLFGGGREAMLHVAAINPFELLDAYDVRPGEFDLFVAYGGQDEFNIHAQVEAFLWKAQQRGIEVGVAYDPCGRHDLTTGLRLLPAIHRWSAARTPP